MPVRPARWLEGLNSYPIPSGGEGLMRLDLNESPWGPPRRVVDAVAAAAAEGNRYPRREEVQRLYGLLSSYTGFGEDHIVLGLGGDMVLEKAFHLVAEPGAAAAVTEPGFSMYPVYAANFGLRTRPIRLRISGDRWLLDHGGLAEAAALEDVRIIVVDNPNNPTGSLLFEHEEELAEILENACRRGVLVVLDEAYYEFSGITLAGLVEAYDCLLVVRTLSKAFGLAGFRVGYGIASPGLAEKLRALMPPFLPRTSVAAAIAALEEPSYAAERVSVLRREREWLRARLRGLGVKAYRSWTNFVLARVPGIQDPVGALAERGVLVRRVSLEGGGWMRVTVGSPRDNSVFLSRLAELLLEAAENPATGSYDGLGEGDPEEAG